MDKKEKREEYGSIHLPGSLAARIFELAGDEYLRSIGEIVVKEMVLGLDYAFVGELKGPGRIRTMAVYALDRFIENVEYDLEDTPCDLVVGRQVCVYPRNVQALFPRDRILVRMNAQSYIGVPLYSSAGLPLGLIAALGVKPISRGNQKKITALLQIFAAKAAVELERRQAEQDLKKSEENYRSIFDAVNDAIFVHDTATGRVVSINRKTSEMFGRSAEEFHDFSNESLFTGFPGYTAKDALRWIRRASEGPPQLFEWLSKKKDGTLFWIEVNLKRAVIGGETRVLAVARDITDRKRAESRLKESEKNLRTVLDSVYDAVFIHDLDGTIIGVNRKMLELYRVGREQALRSTIIHDFSAPDNPLEQVPELWNKTIAGQDQLFEWKARRPADGSVFDVEVFLHKMTFQSKEVILANVRDITGRKRAEEQRNRLSRMHQLILESAGEGIFGVDGDGNYTFMNDAAAAMLGLTQGEVVGRHTHCIYKARPDGTLPGGEECMAYAAYREGKVLHVDDEEFCRKDGTRFPVEYTSTPIIEGGKITGAVVTFRDITERRKAEETLKLTQFAVDHASVAAYIVARDARILYVNEQACRGLGFSREELLSMTVPDLDPYFPHSRWGQHWEQLKKEGLLHFESVHRRKDGVHVPMDISVNYLSFGGREYNIAFTRDITERKKAEQELAQLNRQKELILESAGDGIFGMDRRGNHLLANSAGARMLGYTPEELMGRHSHSLWHHTRPDGSPYPGDECLIYKTRHDGISRHVDDEVFWKKDGTSIPVEYTTTPIREGDAITGSVVSFRDITERRRAEEALRISESRFRNLFTQSSISMQIFSPEGGTIEANRAWEELWGLNKDAVKRYNILRDEQLTDKGIMPYIQKGFAGEATEIPAVRYDPGEIDRAAHARWVKAFIYPVKTPAGRIHQVVLMHWDVTEMVEAEEALRESEERFRAFFELAAVGTVQLDPATMMVARANQRFCMMTGYSCEELTGMIFTDLIHPEDRVDAEAFAGMLAPGAPAYDTEKRYVRKDGRIIWVHVWATVVHDARGKPVHTAAIVQDVTERKRMEEEIRHMAHHDALTSLPNRRMFNEIAGIELAQAGRNRTKLAVLFLDLDRFKEINDTLGHAVGDELLKEVASRLKSLLRKSDSIGRIGGDEFNIILADIARPEDVADIARKIVSSFRKPFLIAGHELHVTTSIGVSIYPDDSDDVDGLLRYADMAMYHAKEKGRNSYQFYDPSINIRSFERIRLENMLRRSLELGEMTVYYQPQVNIATGRITCAEALIRWRHPERGLLLPKDFIQSAEETGFITEIDDWVLREVCRQARAWRDAGLPLLCVTVNLSARQFRNPDLPRKIEALLKQTGIPPSSLDIEITESMAMDDMERGAGLLSRLAGTGIRISIDDFGTGYSSFSYLKRMPVEKLKIDRSFVKDISVDRDDREIIHAVTAMAHNMNMKVIAEGVETIEQLSFLQSSDCDEAQGFLFSRALPAEEFMELVSAGNRSE